MAEIKNFYLENSKWSHSEQHPYHLVDPSPWPVFTSFHLVLWALSVVQCFHVFVNSLIGVFISIFTVFFIVYRWFFDIVEESTFLGNHTKRVQGGLLIGFQLFILSECMFFFSLFWALAHFSLIPSVFIGGIWPPVGIETMDPWGVPLVNTAVLVSSGVVVNWALRSLKVGLRIWVIIGLFVTILYGWYFTLWQKIEFDYACFSIFDSVYGSIFFMITGFHGFHVVIGNIFLMVCYIRHVKYHFTREHHVGFTCAAWYWHFVDIVWIGVYLALYHWGAKWQ